MGLVVSREGFPLAFDVFDGNRPDVTMVEEMVEMMEEKAGQAERVWVMDRGMISDENLEFLRRRGARYRVGTSKSMLKRYERERTEAGWEEVVPGVAIKMGTTPEGGEEHFILCRSEGRKEKERAILNRFVERMEKALNKRVSQAQEGKIRNRQKVLLRIRRWMERYSRAAFLTNDHNEPKNDTNIW